MNVVFILVNLFVLITVIVSNTDLTIDNKGWILGFFTNLSYLILPWFFYWFIANYDNFNSEPKKLAFTKIQVFLLAASIIVALLPIAFPDLITTTQTDAFSLFNWVYGWQLLAGQATFWLLFLVLYVIAQDNANRRKNKTIVDEKFTSRITITAIIVYSTPVFFVIDSGFILLSLAIYILGYIVMYNGLQKYYSNETSKQNL